jgi:hypothetical protein
MVSDIRFCRVFQALGALYAIGALPLACAPFSESRGDAPPVDSRRSDDPNVVLKAPLDSGTASGDGGAVSSKDATTTPPPPPAACAGAVDCERVVFVTSETIYGGFIGGVPGGDTMCNVLATASDHPRVAGRKFKAWLSDDASSPSTTFVHGTKPYVRPDGARIAADYAHLTSGNALDNAIELDESGRTQAGAVWSATSPSGQHDGATCSDWQNAWASGGGAQGAITASAGTWTWDSTSSAPSDRSAATGDCGSVDSRIYCFEE